MQTFCSVVGSNATPFSFLTIHRQETDWQYITCVGSWVDHQHRFLSSPLTLFHIRLHLDWCPLEIPSAVLGSSNVCFFLLRSYKILV